METSPVAQRLSKRFVAGETLEQALAVARKLHAEGITVTLDHLGESVTSLAEAGEARDVYLRTLEALHAEPGSGGGNVSLKLTQFGLDLSYDACLANVEQLVRRAAELGAFVRIDMESSEYTDRTLTLVRTLFQRYGAVGVVIQAYLHRSRKDVEQLCGRSASGSARRLPGTPRRLPGEGGWTRLRESPNTCSLTASTRRSPPTTRR